MRTSNPKAKLVSLGIALAISLPAWAQSPAPNAGSQSAPPQTTPGQSTPAQAAPTPAAPSTQQAAPATPTQKAQSSEDDNPLNLTEEQKAKLRPIIMEENQQMEAVRNNTSMTQEQKIAKANQIRAEASPKIKAVLTPEQLQRLAQIQQERAKQQQQENQNSPSNSQSPPK